MLVSKDDQLALWENMDYIDTFATDHAPHTLEEKISDKGNQLVGFVVGLGPTYICIFSGKPLIKSFFLMAVSVRKG